MVNRCHASVTVQQTPLNFIRAHWRNSRYDFISVSKARPEYLELFRLREHHGDTRPRQLIFYGASSSLTNDFIQPFGVVENVLMVTWGSENGNLPATYTETILHIINKAHVMNP